MLGAGGYGAHGAIGAAGSIAGLAAANVVHYGATNLADKSLRSSFRTIQAAVDANEQLLQASRVNFTKSVARDEFLRGTDEMVDKALSDTGIRNVTRQLQSKYYDFASDKVREKVGEVKVKGVEKAVNDWLKDLFSDDDNAGPQSLLQHTKDEVPEALPSVAASIQRQRDFLSSKLDDPSIKPDQAIEYALAVKEPGTALKAIASGNPTPEQLEALAAVYPSMHQDIMKHVEASLEDAPYQTQLIVRSNLKMPIAEPGKLAALQAVAASGAGAQADQMLAPSKRREPRITV